METLTTEGVEFKNGEILTFTQSWNRHAVKTTGTLRKGVTNGLLNIMTKDTKLKN
uniref:Uncharacterized protein n=1 Tax=viral metagenome TaxID=1070528 RepID=A0A6C0HYV5_9ZZZZ